MISLPIISIVVCMAYIVFVLFKFGVPTSLSETFYLLPEKWRWLFPAWCVLTAAPLGVYWFTISTTSLCWIPIVCMIGLLFVGVSCDYKAPVVLPEDIVKGNTAKSKSIKELLKTLSFKELFKNGWTKPIHYANSILIIILSTVYICIMNNAAIMTTLLLYPLFILIGLKVDGVYNSTYSADVDNKAWIFFMEVICFVNLFSFIVF